MGIAVNNIVPGRAGDLARAYWLSRDGHGQGSSAFSAVVVDRTTDVLVLVAIAVLSYPFVPHPAWTGYVFEASAVCGGVLVVALACTRIWVGRRSTRRHLLPAMRWHWLRRTLSRTLHAVAATVNRRDLPAVSGLAVLAWSAFMGAAWAVGQSLGISLSLPELAFTTAVVNLGVALPSAPGFVGTYQWLCVASLGLVGIDRPAAFAFSILLQGSWYIPTTAVGIALLLRDAGRWRGPRGLRADTSAPESRTTW